MATIVTRSGKGSPLTNTEVDSNFTSLNSEKLEDAAGSVSSDGNQYVRQDGAWSTITEGATVTVSTSKPSSPTNGDLWFSEGNGVMYVYYEDGDSNQWVAAGAPILEQFQATGTSVGTLQAVTSNGNTTTNNVTVADLTASSLNNLAYPSSDGTSGQFLKTDGSGNLSFGNVATDLDSVTDNGATTTNAINTGAITASSMTAASIAYPTSDGTDGQFLKTNGSGTLSFDDTKYLHLSAGTSSNFDLESSTGGDNFLIPNPNFWTIEQENPTSIANGSYLRTTETSDSTLYGGYVVGIPTGKWLVNGSAYFQRSDTGSAIGLILCGRSGWAKSTIVGFDLGSGSSYEYVYIPFTFIWDRTNTQVFFVQATSAYSSTKAKLLEAHITMMRLTG